MTTEPTTPAPPKTPGQMAYEAYFASLHCAAKYAELMPDNIKAWEAAARAVLAHEWVGVGERWPDECGPVLICDDGDVEMAWFVQDGHGTEMDGPHFADRRGDIVPSVTHWRPLPQPPTGAGAV